jgi:hypothetical protein
MEPNDQADDNLYALFPGIDTEPFGSAAGSSAEAAQLNDDGWSAVPERTIVDAGVVGSTTPPGIRSRGQRRGFVTWAALGLATGAVAAVVAGSLAGGGSTRPRTPISAAPGVRYQAGLAQAGESSRAARARHRASTPRHQVHHAARSDRHRRTGVADHLATVSTTASTEAAPPPTEVGVPSQSQPVASQASDEAAGPTGAGALTGAGSTPSG